MLAICTGADMRTSKRIRGDISVLCDLSIRAWILRLRHKSPLLAGQTAPNGFCRQYRLNRTTYKGRQWTATNTDNTTCRPRKNCTAKTASTPASSLDAKPCVWAIIVLSTSARMSRANYQSNNNHELFWCARKISNMIWRPVPVTVLENLRWANQSLNQNGLTTLCCRSGRPALHVSTYTYIYPARKDYTHVHSPFLICFHRNTDRSALFSTIIRPGLNVKVDSYILPPKNGFNA